MVQKFTAILLIPLALGLSGCSFSDKYANKNMEQDEYVYVIDYEKIGKISTANHYSPAFVKTLWVNYPKKRVKKSELENPK
ncbi:MAG: hypothetical protein HWE16_12480 [Gammaproteobacteria bacterium]|nr:hypothetical protein [Gammaproteobacteria bacterium]